MSFQTGAQAEFESNYRMKVMLLFQGPTGESQHAVASPCRDSRLD